MSFLRATRLVLGGGVVCCSMSSLLSCASSSDTTEPRNVDAAAARPQPEARTSEEQPGAVQEAWPRKPAAGVDALPEGPCRKAVSCEDVQVLFGPGFMFEGRELCFVDAASQCACGRQLGVDEADACPRY